MMNSWIINIGFVFFICILFAGILIPKILLISFRKKLFDLPDERKIHHVVVPRLGGIAFKPVIFISIALMLGINLIVGKLEVLNALNGNLKELAFSFCSIMVLYLVGMADDLIGVRYRAKFAIQILCSIMLIAGGLWISNIGGIAGLHNIPEWLGYPFTVLIIVFIINAINLIDGIDGLASMLSCVALLFYGLTFFILKEYIYATLAFATMGVLAPFFYYNVFGNAERGRKIFMGDTGSLTIGIILSLLSIKISLSLPEESIDIPNPFVLAFAPLIVPCFDVVRVFLHRIRNGRNPFMPDKSHIHHKLLAIGMQQHTALITIVVISILFTLGNILLSQYVNINLLLIADIVIWTVGNILLSNKIKQHQSELATN